MDEGRIAVTVLLGGSSPARRRLWGVVVLCLVTACRTIADYERSPSPTRPDAGGEGSSEESAGATEPDAADAASPSPDDPRMATANEARPAPAPAQEPVPPSGSDAATTMSPGGSAGLVGSACVDDADCARAEPFPLSCITSRSEIFPGITPYGSTEQPLGGPAGGYCSRTCGGEGECGPDAVCVDHGGLGAFCYALCNLTTSTPQCLSGGPQACAALSNISEGACYPLCRSDEQCGEGRSCDAATGLCEAELPQTGGGLGAPCTVDTQAADCRSGLCRYDLDTGEGICTGLCRAGEIDCGGAAGEAALGSVCISDEQSPGSVGSCVPLCDTDADCERSDYVCRVGSPVAGRRGICDDPAAFVADDGSWPTQPPGNPGSPDDSDDGSGP
jgi:hypothetical protein